MRDMTGRIVLDRQVEALHFRIDLEGLPTGRYTVWTAQGSARFWCTDSVHPQHAERGRRFCRRASSVGPRPPGVSGRIRRPSVVSFAASTRNCRTASARWLERFRLSRA